MPLEFRPFTLTPLAMNEDRFTDFAPYVPAIDDHGVVAFQATLRDGNSGVFTSDGRAIADVAVSTSPACPARSFTSHPDIDGAGTLAVYVTLRSGDEAVLRVHADGRIATTSASDGFRGIGPLGPTMNAHGDVALRGTLPDGRACIRVWRGDRCEAIAEAGDRDRDRDRDHRGFIGFEGLPVIDEEGQVVFHAILRDDRHGLFVKRRDAQCVAVAVTGNDFDELARFPTMNDRGTVAFAARRSAGAWGIFTARAGRLDCVVDAGSAFESFRGVLVGDAGPVAFHGTPVGGRLGIYTGPDPARHRLLGLGDPLFGATIVDFALNPVSINPLGQLAIRIALDDGRQFILRADPGA